MARLEFCLPPADLPRLLRKPVFGRRSGRGTAANLVWHDTAGGELAAELLSLCQTKSGWRLERCGPRPGEAWPPGTPAPLVAEAAELTALPPLPGPLIPVAGFEGECRLIRIGSDEAATLMVLSGVLRGVAQAQPSCRLLLDGPPALLASLTVDWAASLPITPAPCSLATEALAVARGMATPRRSGAPRVPAGQTVADAFVSVVGHLTGVILAGVPDAAAGLSEAPVHEMRVAVRRLRSALSVFGRVVGDSSVGDVKQQLSAFARMLGAARDWDVFLAGAGASLAAAMPDEPRIQALLTDAARQRDAAYAVLREEFASARFRQLGMALVHLAALRPWEIDADEAQLALLGQDARDFAKHALARQHRRLLSAGPDIAAAPAEDLHALRKQGKKLRYTTEFFAEFYHPRRVRRFLRRVTRLQEALGHLNDAAAAASLMQPLAGSGARQFAIGAVRGFTAAGGSHARVAVAKSWAKVRRAKPFWL